MRETKALPSWNLPSRAFLLWSFYCATSIHIAMPLLTLFQQLEILFLIISIYLIYNIFKAQFNSYLLHDYFQIALMEYFLNFQPTHPCTQYLVPNALLTIHTCSCIYPMSSTILKPFESMKCILWGLFFFFLKPKKSPK